MPDFLESRHTIANAEDASPSPTGSTLTRRNVDGETERLKHDRGIGVVAPDFTLDKTIAIIGGGAAEKPEQSAVLATFKKQDGEAGLSRRQAGRAREPVDGGEASFRRSNARSRN